MRYATNQKPLYDEWRAEQPEPITLLANRERTPEARLSALQELRMCGLRADTIPFRVELSVSLMTGGVIYIYNPRTLSWWNQDDHSDNGVGMASLIARLKAGTGEADA